LRIGFTSYAFRWAIGTRRFTPSKPLTPFDLLERATTLGAEVVQICENLPLENFDDVTLKRLRREARKREIVLEVGTVGARSEHLLRFIEIARLIGAHLLRVVEDMQGWEPTIEELAREIRQTLSACHAYDVTIAIENHFRLSSTQLVELVKAINDDHVGICLDTANSIARLEGWRETVCALADYTVSLHLKDVAVRRKGTGFYLGGRPLGEGVIDLPAVLEMVRANGRDPNALVELWMDFAQDEETTLRQEEEWVNRSITYLRHIIKHHE